MVGYISSGNCLGIAPVAEELKKLTVLFDCGTPRIFEDASCHYVFRPTATIDSIGAARYLLAKAPGVKNYGGLNQNYAWGQDSWRDFDGAMKVLLANLRGTGLTVLMAESNETHVGDLLDEVFVIERGGVARQEPY